MSFKVSRCRFFLLRIRHTILLALKNLYVGILYVITPKLTAMDSVLAQSVERWSRVSEVADSNPSRNTGSPLMNWSK